MRLVIYAARKRKKKVGRQTLAVKNFDPQSVLERKNMAPSSIDTTHFAACREFLRLRSGM